MSVELRLLKDAVTGQPFVPVTHWDAVSNKPNIDGSLNSINASLNALDASIKNINIPIKSITGETGLVEYANSEFVAVSVSEPNENGNVNIDASVKAVTLANASNGHNGLAIAQDVYKELVDVEEVASQAITQVASNIGLDSSLNLVWNEESGLTSENIKEAVEKITISIPTKTSELDNDSGFLTEHLNIKTIDGNELTGSGNIELKTINNQTIIGSGDITISNNGVYQDPTSKKVYIEGIGGFNGTDSSSSQSLEEYLEGVFRNISSHINELITRVEALESK